MCKGGNAFSLPVLTGDRLVASVIVLTVAAGQASLAFEVASPANLSLCTKLPPDRTDRPGSGSGGVHTLRATPVPIPNTEVKPQGPMVLRKWESRSTPPLYDKPSGTHPGACAFPVWSVQLCRARHDYRARSLSLILSASSRFRPSFAEGPKVISTERDKVAFTTGAWMTSPWTTIASDLCEQR